MKTMVLAGSRYFPSNFAKSLSSFASALSIAPRRLLIHCPCSAIFWIESASRRFISAGWGPPLVARFLTMSTGFNVARNSGSDIGISA